jgi:serine/threonine-protein kinase
MADDGYKPSRSPGEQIGNYKIVRLIGRGGLSEVYLARNVIVEKRVVAIKVLARRFHDRPDLRKRLEREAAIYDALDHPNIVRIHDVGVLPDGTVYIVMDLIRGRTLREHLALGPLDLTGALHVMIEVTSAMCFAHRKDVLHRDLKPDNIMIAGTDVKVLDFGIAKYTQAGTDSHDMPLMGTIGFLSPEQIANKPVDGRSDIYALGVIFYITLSGGRHPFENDDGETTDSEMVARHLHAEPQPLPEIADCPEAAWRIVRKCLAKSPDDRFATMDELLEDLTELIDGSMPSGSPVAQRAVEEREIARSSVNPAAPAEPAQRRTEPLVNYTYASPAFNRNAPPPAAPPPLGKGHTVRIDVPPSPAAASPTSAAAPPVVQLQHAFAPAKVELTPSASEAASPPARTAAPRSSMQHATSSKLKSAPVSNRSVIASGAFTGLILATLIAMVPGFRAAVRPRSKAPLEAPAAVAAPAPDHAGPSHEASSPAADAGKNVEGRDAAPAPDDTSPAATAAAPSAAPTSVPEGPLTAVPRSPAASTAAHTPSSTASPAAAPPAAPAPAPARVAAARPSGVPTPAPRAPAAHAPAPQAPAPTATAPHRLFGSE